MNDIDDAKGKLAEYVCNVIGRAKRAKEYEALCKWFEDQGCDIFDIKPAEIPTTRRRWERDAESSPDEYKEQLCVFLDDAREKISDRYLKNGVYRSDYEQILDFLAETADMTKTEIKYLEFIANYCLNNRIKNFLDNVYDIRGYSRTQSFDECFLSLFEKSSLVELKQAKRKTDKLGLTENSRRFDEAAELSFFGKKLFESKPTSYKEFHDLFFGKKQATSLKWNDFTYVEKRDEVCALLKEAAARKEKGVNILFYGIPGTGKTEFSRVLARMAGVDLYAIKCQDEDDNMHFRQSALMFSQKLVANRKNVCLLMDEAEDIFFSHKPETKFFLNTMLENNETPIIWTTNQTMGMDPAFLRRFTYSIHFEIPDEEHCVRIWQKVLRQNKLPAKAKTATELYKEYAVPPAFIANAAKIERLIGGGIKTVKSSLDNMRELCRGLSPKKGMEKPAIPFDPCLLNTDTDLEKLAERVKKLALKKFSLCLYGAPGTGKSAYAVWLAEKLKMPVIKKRCSDLLSMWHGETEHNIRKAFAEAAKRKAVLIFDEADGFLQDRRNAVRSWETTQVNEMLTQMESAETPFICTTNLLDVLDQASLRRFTFKVKYNFMTEEQRTKAFAAFFGFKGVSLPDMENLTPADFALVHKKASILGILKDKKELIKMLTAEQEIKAPPKRKLGF